MRAAAAMQQALYTGNYPHVVGNPRSYSEPDSSTSRHTKSTLQGLPSLPREDGLERHNTRCIWYHPYEVHREEKEDANHLYARLMHEFERWGKNPKITVQFGHFRLQGLAIKQGPWVLTSMTKEEFSQKMEGKDQFRLFLDIYFVKVRAPSAASKLSSRAPTEYHAMSC